MDGAGTLLVQYNLVYAMVQLLVQFFWEDKASRSGLILIYIQVLSGQLILVKMFNYSFRICVFSMFLAQLI